MKHIAPQTNGQPMKALQTVINLPNQEKLSEGYFLNAFADQERDPSNATGRDIEN